MLLTQGKNPKEISHILNVSLDAVYSDQKQIKDKATEYFRTENNNAYGYYYHVMFETIDRLDNELWQLYDNKDQYSIGDKLAVIKSIRENTTARKELVKDVTNIFDLTKLQKDIKEIKEIVNSDPTNTKSFMNISLPQLNNKSNNNDPLSNTYIVDTDNSNNNNNKDNNNKQESNSNTKDNSNTTHNTDISHTDKTE
ncbi:hypothetical protein [Serratia sp. (in: enterobacteria)]|uniref:hypothetical protein n=1 Tax=Serratia sp. (in: enterobacteria) TaxID=616 RepID=UPI00398A2070